MAEPATDVPLETPSRLTIRVKLVSEEAPPPPPPAQPRLSRGAMLVVLAVGAAVLGWFGISSFKSEPPAQSAATGAPVVSEPPATETAANNSAPAEAAAVEPLPLQQQPDGPTTPVNEVIPDVPQSALDTIRGTVRVAVRVSIDKQGVVLDATAQDRGPSRYFERLSVDASRKWAFTPASSDERRTMLVRFSFTRYGARAEASQMPE